MDRTKVEAIIKRVVPEAEFAPFTVRCTDRREFTRADEVWRALADLGACTGWWESTANYRELPEDAVVTPPPGEAPIAAELSARGVSWHLRQEGPGWILRRLEQLADAGAFGSREAFLLEGRPGWCVCYEVGWEARPDPWGVPTLRPVATRFCGFAKDGGAL